MSPLDKTSARLTVAQVVHSYQAPHKNLSGMTNVTENVLTRKRNIISNPLDCGRAEKAHLTVESFWVGAFIAVLGVLSSGIDQRADDDGSHGTNRDARGC